MTSRWCLVAVLTLAPVLSWVVAWLYTENVQERLAERGHEYSRRLVWAEAARDRLMQDNRNLESRHARAEAARDRSAGRLRLLEQDYSALREVLETSEDRRLALLEQENRSLRSRLVALSRLEDENERSRETSPRAALEDVDRLRDENRTVAGERMALAEENMGLEDEIGRLRVENGALGELHIFQRVSTTWMAGFAVAGLLAFTVLQHNAARITFVDAVRSERDRLRMQLQELGLWTDGLKEAAVERDHLKRRVKRLENEATGAVGAARECDRLKTRLEEVEAERDGLKEAAVERDRLKRRVKRLESKAAGAVDSARERDRLRTRLEEVEAERDGLQIRVRRLEHDAAGAVNVVRERDRLRTRLRESRSNVTPCSAESGAWSAKPRSSRTGGLNLAVTPQGWLSWACGRRSHLRWRGRRTARSPGQSTPMCARGPRRAG